MMKALALISVITLFVSCQSPNSKESTPTEIEKTEPAEETPTFANEIEFAHYCIDCLRYEKFSALESFIADSVLFSNYGLLDKNSSIKLSFKDIKNPSNHPIYWGMHPAKGDSIFHTKDNFFTTYLSAFTSDAPPTKKTAYVGKNPPNRDSKQVDYLKYFPTSTYVDFYIAPSKEGYLDWNELIIVVKKVNEKYQLQAVVHNQWMP